MSRTDKPAGAAPCHARRAIGAARLRGASESRRVEDVFKARNGGSTGSAGKAGTGIVRELRHALRARVIGGRCSADEVAGALSVHRRTLNRCLQREGTTFRAVLDGVRFEAARDLLRDASREIEDVARALGYAEPSAFTRAFRRWAGVPPSRWRDRS
jgi:AraC-like DNA-binding protein